MSLRIVSQQQNLGLQLAKILLHYFKKPDIISQTSQSQKQANKDSIYIDTKYFTCTVPLQLKNINNNTTNCSEPSHKKVDMLIFTFNQQQQVQNIRQLIDSQTLQYKPQVTTIVINTKYPNNQQQQQWKYQSDIAECQNFVSVIYQNLGRIVGMWPKWTNSTLLQEEEEYMEIFGLFEIIQTTQWTNTIPKHNTVKNTSKNSNKSEVKTIAIKQLQHQNQKQQENQGQVKVQVQPEVQQNLKDKFNKKQQESQNQQGDKRKKGQMAEECPEEVEQEQLQMEMREFQMMMQQMMEIKAIPQSNQKKKRAEDFILKLAKNMDY